MADRHPSTRKAVLAGEGIAARVHRARAAALRRRRAAIAAAASRLPATTARIAPRFVRAAGPPGLGTLVAEGDSWFDYPGEDVLDALESDHGFEIESAAHHGDRIEEMAYLEQQYRGFCRTLEKLLRRGERPRAILVSGGGNDVAGDEFFVLLDHARSASPGLNEDVVRGVIDVRVRNAYVSLIAAITKLCVDTTGQAVPILVHGYGRAVPDGRGFLGGWWFLPGPWLRPGFHHKGFLDQRRNRDTIAVLIDRFNAMVEGVAAGFPHVHYVDLRDLLPNGARYRRWWRDELHPTREGFRRIAGRFARVIRGLP
jgi:hypothetical protein